MYGWLEQQQTLLFVMSIVSVAMFVGSLVAVPILCIRMDADHFIRPPAPRTTLQAVLRTGIALVLFVMGVAMLVLPGQGILTILMGLSILDFPWKRKLERRILGRPHVLKAMNALRARANKPPFQRPEGRC